MKTLFIKLDTGKGFILVEKRTNFLLMDTFDTLDVSLAIDSNRNEIIPKSKIFESIKACLLIVVYFSTCSTRARGRLHARCTLLGWRLA